MTPDTVLALANLTLARKPDRRPTVYPDPLAVPATAARALSLPRLAASELPALRELHATVLALVDALVSGRAVARRAARLAELAHPSTARVRLEAGEEGSLLVGLQWSDPTPAATLARMVALELGEIDPRRLRRCQRPECDLVFYDTTRSGTRRWHAESPCGVRERQRRHRAGGG
jgi:predicted RNA-binding Zn ribbon-like protein